MRYAFPVIFVLLLCGQFENPVFAAGSIHSRENLFHRLYSKDSPRDYDATQSQMRRALLRQSVRPQQVMNPGAWPARLRLLLRLKDETDRFVDYIAHVNKTLSAPVIPPGRDDEIRARWAAFLRRRKALLCLMNEYFDQAAGNFSIRAAGTEGKELPGDDAKKAIIAYGAALFLFSSAVQIAAELEKPSNLIWRKLDEADNNAGVPVGSLSSLYEVVTDRRNIEALARARRAYLECFPASAERDTCEDLLSLREKIRLDNRVVEENSPTIWRAKLRKLWRLISTGVYRPWYRVKSAVSIWIGDTKYVRKEPAIGPERIRQMTEKLLPGDILLERENWFMSNAFLPGFWPHGILYVGTLDDIKKMGLDKDPRVRPHLPVYSSPDQHGHVRRVLESISEGVLASSMEEATDADYICAFRPLVPQEVKREAIARAFSHMGKPYDFAFDFQTADKIVCTELVWRAYGDFIRLKMKKMMGVWAVPAGEFIEKYARERGKEDRQLDFVFFLDSDYKTGRTWFSTGEALIQSNERPGLALFFRKQRRHLNNEQLRD